MIRANITDWQRLIADDETTRRRPDVATWSALEYACHVRDVYALFHQRLLRMLDEDDPLFDNWNQDVTAEEQRYVEQDPVAVVRALASEGAALADAFDAVEPAQWSRPGRRSDGAAFTVNTFATYLIHDPVHHVWDVEQGFDRLHTRPA